VNGPDPATLNRLPLRSVPISLHQHQETHDHPAFFRSLLMVIFEDLHWIDEATQDLLNLRADSLGTAKILLLVNYRPEYSHHYDLSKGKRGPVIALPAEKYASP